MIDSYILSLHYPYELINIVKKLNLNPILIDGIKGSKLSFNEIDNNINDDLFSLINPKSSLGCAMSHLKAWKQFRSNNSKPYALFLEDDAIFEPHFKKDFNAILKNTPNDFDILYLGCFFCDKEYNNLTLYINNIFGKNKDEIIINDYIKIPQIVLAAHSYVLSKKGADKLIKLFDNNLYYHIDNMILQEFYKNNLQIYCVRKRLVYQTSSSCITNSENVSSNHPLLFDYILDNYEVDKHASLIYFKNLSIFRLGDINFNIMSVIFLISGVILLFFKIDMKVLITFYFLISICDIFQLKNINLFIINGLFFMLPTLIKNIS